MGPRVQPTRASAGYPEDLDAVDGGREIADYPDGVGKVFDPFGEVDDPSDTVGESVGSIQVAIEEGTSAIARQIVSTEQGFPSTGPPDEGRTGRRR